MNAPSPLLRPLVYLAALLGVAIVALFVVWIRMEPRPTPAAPDAGAPVPVRDPIPAAAASAERQSGALAETSAPATAPGPAAAIASAVLYGTVSSASGEAVSRGFLWVARDGRNVGTASLQGGTFTFAGLRPGKHSLTSRIDDELPLDQEVLVEAPVTRLDLELEACHVLAVDAVTPEGGPLVDALPTGTTLSRSLRALAFATALAGDLPPTDQSEIEGGLGPFRARSFLPNQGKPMSKQTVGVLTLPPIPVVHVALVLGTTLVAQQQVDPSQERVTFVVASDALLDKRCAVRVRFVDENGAPIADARVSISSAAGMSMGGRPGAMITDADGCYRATGLVPGSIGIGLTKAGLVSPPLRCTVAAGADLDLGNVVVRAAVDVELSLANFGDRGGVWLSPDLPPGTRADASQRYVAVDNGRQQKVSLYPGRYTALATASAGVAVLSLDTAALPPQPIRFELRPGAPLDLRRSATGSFVQFDITTRRGALLRRGNLGIRASYPLTLPPGEYTAVVADRDGTVTRREFMLPAGGLTLAIP